MDTSSTTQVAQKNGQTLKTLWFLLNENLYGHPLAGLLWERQFEEVLLGSGWGKCTDWECLFVHRKQGLFLLVYVDDIEVAGRKNMGPKWKTMMKLDNLGEPTSFLDHVYLGCAQRECKPNETALQEDVRNTNFCWSNEPHAKTVAWSHDMEGHVKKCFERYCELANKKYRAVVQSLNSMLGRP